MLIPVTLDSSSSSLSPKLPSGLVKISHDEIVLIELQGSLDVECNHPSERNGKFVGKLKIDEATNRSSLLIGNHLLEGKIAALPKPLAVLIRNGSSPSTADEHKNMRAAGASMEADDVDIDGSEDAMVVDQAGTAADGASFRPESSREGSSTGWTIAAIVKKKIIFSKRPMPVMSKK